MRTVLITGANRGIGLALARLCHACGARVIAACRRRSAELDGLGVRVEEDVDVTDDGSVEALAQRLGRVVINTLINNAGVFVEGNLHDPNYDGIREQFEVNTLGPLRVTRALLPHLRKGSKVAIITSKMGSIAADDTGGYYGYRISKAGVNMVGATLARDLRASGIAVALLHPGYVDTDMTRHKGHVAPDDSARGLLAMIDRLTLEESGGFWDYKGRPIPW